MVKVQLPGRRVINIPLYDYRCNQCTNEFEGIRKIAERYNIKCPKCEGAVQIIHTSTKIEIFKPFWHEDFDDKPVLVKSKAHYKELCKKHGVYAPHVFGQGWNISEI